MTRREALLDDLPPVVSVNGWVRFEMRHSALELVEDHAYPCFMCAHPEHPAKPGVVWSQVIPAAASLPEEAQNS
jgi:hypothetical protein